MLFVGLLAIIVLVAINGFFVAAEFALVKVRATRLAQLVAEGRRGARAAAEQVRHLDLSIAATQLGVTLASLALGWLGEPALAQFVEIPLHALPGILAVDVADGLAIAFTFLVITALQIVLGELVPKAIALQRSERVALWIAPGLAIFQRVFHPFIVLMNSLGNRTARMIGFQPSSEITNVHSAEEIEMLVIQSREAGLLDQREEVMLRQVFDFGDRTAREVMTPRSRISAVPSDISRSALLEWILGEQFTRYPVFNQNLDTVIGLIHIKDCIAIFADSESTFSLGKLLRPILNIPETTRLEDLLPTMRVRQVHMAVIFDEYGATTGLVTMEDIVEELVGEVNDEFDTGADAALAEVQPLSDGTFSVDGLMRIDAFAERFGFPPPDSVTETVGGYVMEQLDHIPSVGETIEVGGYTMHVREMDGRRVGRVQVARKSAARSEQATNNSAP